MEGSHLNRFCEHCEEFVSARTFLRHRDAYYNDATNIWKKDPSFVPSSSEDDCSACDEDSNLEMVKCVEQSRSLGEAGILTTYKSAPFSACCMCKLMPHVYIHLYGCPAKSPLTILCQIFQDKQKESNARIEMYG